jgi:predicted GIY-YIG superfamily endonuclease
MQNLAIHSSGAYLPPCRSVIDGLCKFEKKLMSKTLYRVYVIELSKRVFTDDRRFREANPQFNGVLECLYVGMTSKTPAERFAQHKKGAISKKGHKLSAKIVKKYGSYLRPSLYNHIKPMNTRLEALEMEKKLAMDLRRKRYAVWFN